MGGPDRTVLINRADLKGSPFYELSDWDFEVSRSTLYKTWSCHFHQLFFYLILWIWKGFHQNLVTIFSHSSRFLFNFILFSKSNLRLVIKSSLSDLSINVPLNVRHHAFFAHYFLETLQSCQLQTQSVKWREKTNSYCAV